jgi:hypothetical protein
MNNISLKICVVFKLGLLNALTVAVYRFMLWTGWLEKIVPVGDSYRCQPFTPPDPAQKGLISSVENADKLLQGRFVFFGAHEKSVGTPPAWFANPFNETQLDNSHLHWTCLPDFTTGVGDIKVLWELSRFGWAVDFARAYQITGDQRYVDALNDWVDDWVQHNPLNRGPNWKCGQETAIRMQHLLLAAYLLKQHIGPKPELVRFVEQHCQRIDPTLSYALAQNNNHGTSEAAALFVGGAWLRSVAVDPPLIARSVRWREKGRRLLLKCTDQLVAEDGSFSQYSTTYHKMVVDTLNITEFWRRELSAGKFSKSFYVRACALGCWLARMTDSQSGDVPNVGANDSSLLFPLSSAGPRDFRPSVQLASVLFNKGRVYPEGAWDEPLFLLNIEPVKPLGSWAHRKACQFKDGGYVLFSNQHNTSWGVLRYPNYNFRPGHADALHLDLWSQGMNILRDSGTYSYNSEERLQAYFGSTGAHNTVELDGHDQMPLLGRFLRGSWLKMGQMEDLRPHGDGLLWSGEYTDYKGASHRRTVEFGDDHWRIVDCVAGCKSHATLRWRLAPGQWCLDGYRCTGQIATLTVSCNEKIHRSGIVEGWESRHYWQKRPLPVWEIEVQAPAAIFETCISIRKRERP